MRCESEWSSIPPASVCIVSYPLCWIEVIAGLLIILSIARDKCFGAGMQRGLNFTVNPGFLVWVSRQKVVTTDASLSSWGEVWQNRTARRQWSPQDRRLHVNVLKQRSPTFFQRQFSCQTIFWAGVADKHDDITGRRGDRLVSGPFHKLLENRLDVKEV